MFCHNCGNQVGDNAAFCPNCGTKLMRPQAQQDIPQEPVQPAAPVEEPIQQSAPVEEPAEAAAPIEEPAQAAPVEEATQAVPVEEPAQAAPIEEPVEAAPVEEPAQAAPVEEPVQQNIPVGGVQYQANNAGYQQPYQNQYQQNGYQQNQYQQNGYQQNQYQQNGYQQNQYQQNAYQQNHYQQTPYGMNNAQPAKKPFNKKPLIIGIIIAAIVAAALIVLFVVNPFGFGGGNQTTPEGTLKKIEAGLNDLDFQKIIDCCDSSTRDSINSSSLDLSQIDTVKDTLKLFDAEYKFTLTPIGSFDYYTEDGQDFCDVEVELEAYISAFGQEETDSDTTTMTFVKEGNEWFVYSGDMVEDFIDSFASGF